MTVLPVSLAESDRLYPLPEAEAQRNAKRRRILNYVPRGEAGAEIGAARGHFSEALLEYLRPQRAYLVDPWTLRGEVCDGAFAPSAGPLPTRVARQDAQWRTDRFTATQRHFIEAFFPAGAAQIAEPLDWIYLAASHGFEAALAELQAAEKLLKPRGILFGDHWWPDPRSAHHGVYQAVNKFTRLGKFELIACGPYGQWAVRRRGPWKIRPGDAAETAPSGAERPAAPE